MHSSFASCFARCSLPVSSISHSLDRQTPPASQPLQSGCGLCNGQLCFCLAHPLTGSTRSTSHSLDRQTPPASQPLQSGCGLCNGQLCFCLAHPLAGSTRSTSHSLDRHTSPASRHCIQTLALLNKYTAAVLLSYLPSHCLPDPPAKAWTATHPLHSTTAFRP